MLDERQESKALSGLALHRVLCFPLQSSDRPMKGRLWPFPSHRDETSPRPVLARGKRESQEHKPCTLHSKGFRRSTVAFLYIIIMVLM